MNCAHKTKEPGDEGAGDIFMTMYGEKILEQDTKCTKYKKKTHTFEYIKIKITFKTHYKKRKREATDRKIYLLCI